MHEMHFHYQEQPHPVSKSTWDPTSPLGSRGKCWHMQDTPRVPCPWASAWSGGPPGQGSFSSSHKGREPGDHALGVKISIAAPAAMVSQPQTAHQDQ